MTTEAKNPITDHLWAGEWGDKQSIPDQVQKAQSGKGKDVTYSLRSEPKNPELTGIGSPGAQIQ